VNRLLSGWAFAVYLFLYAPIAVLVLFSLNSAEQTAVLEAFTLRWYAELASDAGIREAAWTSLELASLTTLSATALGTGLALGMRSMTARWTRVASALLIIAIVLPEIVMAVSQLRLFGALRVELGFRTAWFSHTVFSIAYAGGMVRARLTGMNGTLEEAAADLGATPWTAFWTVTFPLLWPAILAAALLVFTLSIDDYVVTSFVTGPGTTTLPIQIYAMVRKHVTPEINAVSTALLLVTSIAIAGAWSLERRIRYAAAR
jgi:ABC-type spermidine/putrescine transport system permease subunit II